MRIAILAHSTNPRGGVVHALELGDALTGLGCDAAVHAPDPAGRGFFRPTSCRTVSVAARPAPAGTLAMVRARIADYVAHFEQAGQRDFDLFHAQDGISGNALATLKERGLIVGFARTVHHLDKFSDPALDALQSRSIRAADRLFVVSPMWRDALRQKFDRDATIVGNGVDRERYSPRADDHDDVLRQRLGLNDGPIFLSIGGVEERKNSLRILAAFAAIHADRPTARLVIAGGASLLDHGAYRRAYDDAMAASGLPAGAVIETGPLAQADMPALYRIADALVFPSVTEGFGLVVLEAMASGIPTIVSRIAPFTGYLDEEDAAWCDPLDASSIAAAMSAALEPVRRRCLIERGTAVVARHDWRHTADAHLRAYATLREPQHA